MPDNGEVMSANRYFLRRGPPLPQEAGHLFGILADARKDWVRPAPGSGHWGPSIDSRPLLADNIY